MENEFLHKVSLDLLKSELKMDVSGISSLLGVSEQTIYKWNRDKSKGGCRPTYEAIFILLNNGASLNSIFGVSNFKIPNCENNRQITSEEFMDGVRAALKDLASR